MTVVNYYSPGSRSEEPVDDVLDPLVVLLLVHDDDGTGSGGVITLSGPATRHVTLESWSRVRSADSGLVDMTHIRFATHGAKGGDTRNHTSTGSGLLFSTSRNLNTIIQLPLHWLRGKLPS